MIIELFQETLEVVVVVEAWVRVNGRGNKLQASGDPWDNNGPAGIRTHYLRRDRWSAMIVGTVATSVNKMSPTKKTVRDDIGMN